MQKNKEKLTAEAESITHSERLERDNPWKKVGFHND